MTDFFDSVLDQALGQAPALLPLASSPAWDDTEAPVAAPSAFVPSGFTPPGFAPMVGDASPLGRREETDARPSPLDPMTVPMSSSASIPPLERSPVTAEIEPAPTVPNRTDSVPHPKTEKIEAIVERILEPVEAAPMAPPAEVPPLRLVAEPARQSPAPVSTTVRMVPEPHGQESAIAAPGRLEQALRVAREVAVPGTPPPQELTPALLVQIAAPQAVPTAAPGPVKITIGTIEVKLPDEEPAPAPAPEPPKRTRETANLDDYLGGRR